MGALVTFWTAMRLVCRLNGDSSLVLWFLLGKTD